MSNQECAQALKDPVDFVKSYIAGNKIDKHQVATEADVPYNTVKSFLNGHRSNPGINTMAKLMGFVMEHKKKAAGEK